MPNRFGSEVVFCGRSNAGKSSAINALTGNRSLAKTSKTPGRTQMINFFSVSYEKRIVDLPGYGYAKVSSAISASWRKNLESYLCFRRSLKGVILLMDIRHALKESDKTMIDVALFYRLAHPRFAYEIGQTFKKLTLDRATAE